MVSDSNQQRPMVEHESDEESVEPFARKYEEDDSKDELPDQESEDESIFEKLKDEVENELYNAGPRAIVRRHKDSKLEMRSDFWASYLLLTIKQNCESSLCV